MWIFCDIMKQKPGIIEISGCEECFLSSVEWICVQCSHAHTHMSPVSSYDSLFSIIFSLLAYVLLSERPSLLDTYLQIFFYITIFSFIIHGYHCLNLFCLIVFISSSCLLSPSSLTSIGPLRSGILLYLMIYLQHLARYVA